jgi:hypothetical protein
VNAETPADMVGVDVVVPPGFTLDRQAPLDVKGGGEGGVFITWPAQITDTGIHTAGAGIADGGIVLLTFSGTASKLGTLSFVTITHAADGTTVRWDGPANSRHPAALVYVVSSFTNPAALANPGPSGPISSSGPPWWALGVAGVGGLALVGCLVTSRRRRPGARGS